MSNVVKKIVDTHECVGCVFCENGSHTNLCLTIVCFDTKNYYHYVKKIETDNVDLTKEAQRLRKDLRV